MSRKYFLSRDTKTFGPYTFEQVLAAAKNGKLRKSDKLSAAESGPWFIAGDLPSLKSAFMAPPTSRSDFFSSELKELGENTVQKSTPAELTNKYWLRQSATSENEAQTSETDEPSLNKNDLQKDNGNLCKCEDCGATMSRRAPACLKCGGPNNQSLISCPFCSSALPDHVQICPRCTREISWGFCKRCNVMQHGRWMEPSLHWPWDTLGHFCGACGNRMDK
jgi:hypothetical protein